jgi:tRNA uridine 5-carbamoylmethylation protein Kti12
MKIIIGGFAGEGKTTLAKLIADTLTKKGFQVDNKDPDVFDGVDFQDKRLEDLKDKLDIIEIETIQTVRNGVSGPRKIQHQDSLGKL